MVKSWLLVPLLFLIVGCGQLNPVVSPPIVTLQESPDPTNPDEIVNLPGIYRSVFDETLSAQNIDACVAEPSGPYYRYQTNVMPLASNNYVSFDVYIPEAKIFRSKSGAKYTPNIYSGGDVKTDTGAADIGVAADDHILAPDGNSATWMPFIYAKINRDMKPSTSPDENMTKKGYPAFNSAYRYRLENSQQVSMKFWISSETAQSKTITYFNLSVTGDWIYSTGGKTASKSVSKKELIYKNATSPLWAKPNQEVVYKFMTTLALQDDSFKDYSVGTPAERGLLSGVSFSNLKVAKVNPAGNPIKPIAITGKECFKPSDMVTNPANYSAKVQLRLKGQLDIKPQLTAMNGDQKHDIQGSITLSNIGDSHSKVEITSIKINGIDRSSLILVGGESGTTYKWNIKCPSVSTGLVGVKFTVKDGDTFEYDKDKDDKFFTIVNNTPKYNGSLLERKFETLYPYTCSHIAEQAFKMDNVALRSIINATGQKDVDLNIASLNNSPLTSGQFTFSRDSEVPITTTTNLATTSLTTTNLKAQSIVVSPVFTPNNETFTPPDPTAVGMIKTITVSADCGPTPGLQPDFQARVSDSTGNTDPYTFPVSLTCLGPKISAPTPNPVILSAKVGETATGSFGFSNAGEKDDQNRVVPLNFTVAGTTSLKVSPSNGTVQDTTSQNLSVLYPCTTVGNFYESMTITSNDSSNPSITIPVGITCNAAHEVHRVHAIQLYIGGSLSENCTKFIWGVYGSEVTQGLPENTWHPTVWVDAYVKCGGDPNTFADVEKSFPIGIAAFKSYLKSEYELIEPVFEITNMSDYDFDVYKK